MQFSESSWELGSRLGKAFPYGTAATSSSRIFVMPTAARASFARSRFVASCRAWATKGSALLIFSFAWFRKPWRVADEVVSRSSGFRIEPAVALIETSLIETSSCQRFRDNIVLHLNQRLRPFWIQHNRRAQFPTATRLHMEPEVGEWGRGDSNSHALRHVVLNHARLPIPTLPHGAPVASSIII